MMAVVAGLPQRASRYLQGLLPSRVANLASFTAAWVVAILVLPFTPAGLADTRAYWAAWQGGLYIPPPALGHAGYIYPPPFAQLLFPATLLPWPVFALLWFGVSAAAIWWLVQPVSRRLRLPLFLIFLASSGNIAVFVALAIASRRPWTWAVPLLTKITPGIGVAWYAVRREWRPLAVALGATIGVSVLSFLISPSDWTRWLALVPADAANRGGEVVFFLPQLALWARGLLAAALVVWGARTDRPWTLGAAALLASADILLSALPLLAAIPRLRAAERPAS
jgi:Glycosyltransferase family 87